MHWGFWKPLCWRGCKHTAQSASFASTLDWDVPLSRFREGSAHSQPCRPDRALPPLQQNSSAHVCVLLLLQLATKERLKVHIPKGQEWNLLCWSEIWYLLCSWRWREASLNSFFQVSPLKLLQILALCFFKRVWKQFFWQKTSRLFSGFLFSFNDEHNYHIALTIQSSNIQLMIWATSHFQTSATDSSKVQSKEEEEERKSWRKAIFGSQGQRGEYCGSFSLNSLQPVAIKLI